MIKDLSKRTEQFQGGCISKYYDQWKHLTNYPEILDIVAGMHIPFEQLPMQLNTPTPFNFSDDETEIIDSEISRLLEKKVIWPCSKENGDLISNIFLRAKPGGKYRMILNIKTLNQYVEYNHFKMDSLISIINLMQKGCWMASVDLQDAYYSCPIAKVHTKYLKFYWKGQYYQFVAFPNGLACCPRKFTKLLKPVFATLRKKGHLSSVYIDDTYLQGETENDCLKNVTETVQLLQRLGFTVHPENQFLNPHNK